MTEVFSKRWLISLFSWLDYKGDLFRTDKMQVSVKAELFMFNGKIWDRYVIRRLLEKEETALDVISSGPGKTRCGFNALDLAEDTDQTCVFKDTMKYLDAQFNLFFLFSFCSQ